MKSIPDPGQNFRNAFDGATGDASGVVRALVRVNYAYEGYANAFNVVNEIKVRHPPLCAHSLPFKIGEPTSRYSK